MDINFYFNNSETIKADKDLTFVTQLSGSLKEDCSITKPIILIQSDTFPQGDYVYIEDFGRFYFINDKETAGTNLWRIYLKVDVYSSFKVGIRNCNATLDRQEEEYNLYLPDDKWDAQVNTFTLTKRIGTGSFNVGNVILLLSRCKNLVRETNNS